MTQGKPVVFSQKVQKSSYYNTKALVQHDQNRRTLEDVLDEDFDTESNDGLIRREVNVEMNTREQLTTISGHDRSPRGTVTKR